MQGKEKSIFLLEKLQRFAVPLLALEAYQNAGLSEESSELEVSQALVSAISLCGVSSPAQEDIEYFVERLEGLSASKSQNKGVDKAPTQSLGTAYAKFMRELSVIDILGLMTHYNPSALRYWYCEADAEATMLLVERYVQELFERVQVNFEACMYGFGGKYESDNSGSKVIDANSKEGLAALQQFGVGSISPDALAQLGFSGVADEWFGGSPAAPEDHG